MKSSRKTIFLFSALVLLSAVMFKVDFIVDADSGFDSGYSSGGGGFRGSSSSHHSSGGYSSSGSSNGDGFSEFSGMVCLLIPIFLSFALIGNKLFVSKNKRIPIWFYFLWVIIYIILGFILFGLYNPIYNLCLLIFVVFLVIGLVEINSYLVSFKPLDVNTVLTNDQILSIMGNDFKIAEFYSYIFESYRDIQIAWMNKDIDSVRHLLSDEILNMYRMQLLTLEKNNQTNMMEDIKFVDAGIINIARRGNKETIKVRLEVTCRDYIINADNEVIRGDNTAINHYIYLLTFSRVKGDKANYCPNCGADLDEGPSNLCLYCRSVIINDSSSFIMIDKKMLSQSVKEYK